MFRCVLYTLRIVLCTSWDYPPRRLIKSVANVHYYFSYAHTVCFVYWLPTTIPFPLSFIHFPKSLTSLITDFRSKILVISKPVNIKITTIPYPQSFSHSVYRIVGCFLPVRFYLSKYQQLSQNKCKSRRHRRCRSIAVVECVVCAGVSAQFKGIKVHLYIFSPNFSRFVCLLHGYIVEGIQWMFERKVAVHQHRPRC